MWTRQQDAALLEGFADRGDPEGQRVDVQSVGVRAVFRASGQFEIGFLYPSPRKHQGAPSEVDRVMAHDHEDLQAGGAVAQQQDRGGGSGGGFHGDFLSASRRQVN